MLRLTRNSLLTLCALVLLPLAFVDAADRDTESQRVVLLELFTSQGCSSCPPADRLLTKLGAKGVRGVEVIPLSFHVDYWNYIGWTDPFSAGEWSYRQRIYAKAFKSDTVYTPQIVVDGTTDCVGAYEGEVSRAVAKAAKRPPHAEFELAWTDGPVVELSLQGALSASAANRANILLAVFETDLVTPVGSGENARRTLKNDYVVRSLESVATLKPGESADLSRTIGLDDSWKRDNVGVVVFAQDPETLEILGASALRF